MGDMKWNIFDSVLVIQAWVDEMMVWLGTGEGSSMTFARVLKLLKLGKIFRIFRAFRFLKDLRVLVQSLVSSAGSMVWSFLLMAAILFLFSLVIMSQVNSFLIPYAA